MLRIPLARHQLSCGAILRSLGFALAMTMIFRMIAGSASLSVQIGILQREHPRARRFDARAPVHRALECFQPRSALLSVRCSMAPPRHFARRRCLVAEPSQNGAWRNREFDCTPHAGHIACASALSETAHSASSRATVRICKFGAGAQQVDVFIPKDATSQAKPQQPPDLHRE